MPKFTLSTPCYLRINFDENTFGEFLYPNFAAASVAAAKALAEGAESVGITPQ